MKKVTKEYRLWGAIKERCGNKNNPLYGGRGITVCDRWKNSYADFLKDVGPAPSPNHSMDRINNNGNYEPGNCRWATRFEQNNNKRNNRFVEYKGQIKTIAEWARELNINRFTIESRLNQNWSMVKAFETPVQYKSKQP